MIAHRLGDYRITENEAGELRWAAYAGFGQSMGGTCFIVGNILFLEPSSELNENSYLLLEYHEFLDKLPRWEKTKYFCSSYKIRSCETGATPSPHEIRSGSCEEAKEVWYADATEVTERSRIQLKQSVETGAVSYRLGQYEVIENTDGELLWRAHSGLGRLQLGRCSIRDGILFFEAGSKADPKKPGQPGFLRKEFVRDLSQLSRWERTRYYCMSYKIRSCETGRTLGHEMTSKPSRDRKKNCSPNIRGGNLNPLKHFPLPYDGDTDLKGYFNCFKESLLSGGAHLLFACKAFCSKFFQRRQSAKKRERSQIGEPLG